jgi:hypothetical protein
MRPHTLQVLRMRPHTVQRMRSHTDWRTHTYVCVRIRTYASAYYTSFYYCYICVLIIQVFTNDLWHSTKYFFSKKLFKIIKKKIQVPVLWRVHVSRWRYWRMPAAKGGFFFLIYIYIYIYIYTYTYIYTGSRVPCYAPVDMCIDPRASLGIIFIFFF